MTCANCYFWHPENPTDGAGACWADPPRIIPIVALKEGKPTTLMQNMTPSTERDYYCRFHDPRPRPVIKLASRIP